MVCLIMLMLFTCMYVVCNLDYTITKSQLIDTDSVECVGYSLNFLVLYKRTCIGMLPTICTLLHAKLEVLRRKNLIEIARG